MASPRRAPSSAKDRCTRRSAGPLALVITTKASSRFAAMATPKGVSSGGRLTLESSYLTAIGEQTFNGPGEIVCEGDAYYPCYIHTQHPYGGPYTGFALTFGPTLTIIGHTNTYIRPYYSGNSIINNGIIRADTDQRSIIITNPFTNNGQLQQLNGGVITIQN